MGEKIIVGPINRGLRNDVTPFNIDNDSFPVLVNAFQWRGRVKRKRGTNFLGRLTRFFDSGNISYNSGSTTITLDGSGNGNILTGFSLETNGNIVPGTVVITNLVGPVTYTDDGQGNLLNVLSVIKGTINYATGAITIAEQAGNAVAASFNYYPDLPVMGLRDLILDPSQNTGNLGFDTTYAYNITTTTPVKIYDVSFYKNLQTGTYTNYVQKTNWTPLWWNGADYQQFYSTNYQNAFWVTNGINIPFTGTTIGMQYAGPTTTPALTAAVRTSATTMDFTVVGNPLVVGDFVFVNEFTSATAINATTLNFQTGYVTTAGNTFTVTFPSANIQADTYTPGIVQYLTNRSNTAKDNIRWYDGDPTNGNTTSPTFVLGKGWVNFMPPLSQGAFSIADLPAQQYYLVGARIIVPFRDRLLFFGPVVQASNGNPIYLPDTVIYSQNGTPYYTASFTGAAGTPHTAFTSLLVPTNQTASESAWWEDQTGFGGNITAGLAQAITTASFNEDVIIVGFKGNIQTRLVYTGDDIIPFLFFRINSELGSESTFSTINLDKGVMTLGNRGFVITSQVEARRFDLAIPNQSFEINRQNNGSERVTAVRDFINEWVYFTYVANKSQNIYPNQSLFYNYRDDSWAIFNECYTTYGTRRATTGYTWGTIGEIYPTWGDWDEPWGSGNSNLFQPEVLGGNQQGFVIVKDQGTGEANSLYIQDITVSNAVVTVTSPNHCLNNGDYIIINNVIGTIGSLINGHVFLVSVPTTSNNTFTIAGTIPTPSGTYLGGGTMQRMYIPIIQTKQFPVAWGMSRKTRLGPQQYLFTKTSTGQITLLIYISQDATNAYNAGTIIPSNMQPPINDGLIYSSIVYTCPESTNLGLTAANTNLQQVNQFSSSGEISNAQAQIWHRMNTSLIGDTVQLAITLSDAQMIDEEFNSQFAEIELHGIILDVTPSMVLA